MYCFLSLDTTDPALQGSSVEGLDIVDIFVCPACSMYTQSYQIKIKDAQPVIIYEGGPEERVDEVILPYEVLNVTLEAFDERVITEPATLARMEDRSWWNGKYHLLVRHNLWARLDGDTFTCKSRGTATRLVMIVDSDCDTGIRKSYAGGGMGRISFNWADDCYLAVSYCDVCALFIYNPAHG